VITVIRSGITFFPFRLLLLLLLLYVQFLPAIISKKCYTKRYDRI